MKSRIITLTIAVLTFISSHASEIHYVGGDISLLHEYLSAGAQYKDENGKSIELLPFLYDAGMNAMRVRLFVDPGAFEANHPDDYDPNACQSLPYIIPLCKDILENGFELMLDFHYSDTWADPANQWIPDAWKNLNDEELAKKVNEYTKETLLTLKENGIVPSFIQPGNEISYGMLWAEYGKDNQDNHVWERPNDKQKEEAAWNRFGSFLKAAIEGCREVCPDSEIIIHTERVAQVNELTYFYDKMKSLDIDYDIIGLSYYPYFHGNMKILNEALTTIEKRYPEKPIMIVETGFPYKWEVPGTTEKVDYQYTLQGQNQFAQELVNTLLAHPNVNGLFWWWLEYNPYGTQLEGWYNAPLFDGETGKATPALKTICKFRTSESGVEEIGEEWRNDNRWYDLNGRVINRPTKPGIYIHNREKVIISK